MLGCNGHMPVAFLDFILYTEKDICIERINFDQQLWNNDMLPTFSGFYFKFIMPEILGPVVQS